MAQLFIIADDLTGACDTGAGFAQRGFSTVVVLDLGRSTVECEADVLIFTTESRSIPAEQARQAVTAAARRILEATSGLAQPWVYKKIDSTLRGHPGAELSALMDALGAGAERALVAPAFPAQGRTTAGGVQRVNGQPLEHTVFAAEVPTGDLAAVFAPAGRAMYHLALDDVRRDTLGSGLPAALAAGLWLADAETDSDLAQLMRLAQAAGIRLLCGSAGLASALADALDGSAPPATPASSGRQRTFGPILTVAGSRHPATGRQVEAARLHGITVLQAPLQFTHDPDASGVAELALAATRSLSQGEDVILTTCGLPDSALGRHKIARRFGMLVAQLVSRVPVAGLVLTGGDVAAAVCGALGAQLLQLDGEVQPGIAAGHLVDGALPGLAVVTKAGGFGDDQALVCAIRAIRGIHYHS